MLQSRQTGFAFAHVGFVLFVSIACATPSTRSANATPALAIGEDAAVLELREAERARLRALVSADVVAARRLHADDFQLVNPLGRVASREQYLDAVAAGVTDYHVWEVDSIAVRVYGAVAALRYSSVVEITVRGERRPPVRAWNTALYERRAGRWQIVWFHVTELPPS